MNDNLIMEYHQHMKTSHYNRADDLLICDNNGKHIQRNAIYNQHVRVCKKAELKRIRLHDLRHTFASHWVMNGGSLEDLKEVLGHSTIAMTQKYAHLSPDHLALKANTVSFV